jgi:putative copper resistance protein D
VPPLEGGADVLSLAFRIASFVLLFNAAGLSVFIPIFGPHLSPDFVAAIARRGWKLGCGALICVAGHHLLEAARMTGDMTSLTDTGMQMTALHSSEGAAFVLRMLGLILIIGALVCNRSGGLPGYTGERPRAVHYVGLTGALLATASFTLTGHTSVTQHRIAAGALLTLHLMVAAFWLGALRPLYIAASRQTPEAAGRLIESFSRRATQLVPLILIAGAVLAALLVPSLATFRQPYGQLLLAKVCLFAVLMALAALNKWRLGGAVSRGQTRAFRQVVVIEYLLICAVLALTATLTMFYSPEPP